MRSLSDMSLADRSAYFIWADKLKDTTLSPAQHNEARKMMDRLMWSDETGELRSIVDELKAKVDVLTSAVDQCNYDMAGCERRVASLENVSGLDTDKSPTEQPEVVLDEDLGIE